MSRNRPTIQIIQANSRPDENGCWIWTRARTQRGYGQLWWRGQVRKATHLALEMIGVEVPKGMDACHSCDNPPCVNPAHLFVGTRKRNMQDAQAKGRLFKWGGLCHAGHQMVTSSTGRRRCPVCTKERNRQHYLRKRDG